jgi:hypothetical protein
LEQSAQSVSNWEKLISRRATPGAPRRWPFVSRELAMNNNDASGATATDDVWRSLQLCFVAVILVGSGLGLLFVS